MYYVYILKCNDGSFYTGVTSNLELRIVQHNSNEFEGYTKSRRPVRLVFHSAFSQIKDAIESEKQIKGWSRSKKKALIAGDFEKLKMLSKRHASTSSA